MSDALTRGFQFAVLSILMSICNGIGVELRAPSRFIVIREKLRAAAKAERAATDKARLSLDPDRIETTEPLSTCCGAPAIDEDSAPFCSKCKGHFVAGDRVK